MIADDRHPTPTALAFLLPTAGKLERFWDRLLARLKKACEEGDLRPRGRSSYGPKEAPARDE